MRSAIRTILLSTVLTLTTITAWAQVALPKSSLWKIGRAGTRNDEYALAPDRYRQFREDGFFIVGRSETGSAWPYVHPGPADRWAGGRTHTFTIVFGVQGRSDTGACTLQFLLLDTHSALPPHLTIAINGRRFEEDLPPGAGDASLEGRPDSGRSFSFGIYFPATSLVEGDNIIEITNARGSWFLYGSIALEAPAGIKLAQVSSRISVSSARPEPFLKRHLVRPTQSVQLAVINTGDSTGAVVSVSGRSTPVGLKTGIQNIEVEIPSVVRDTTIAIEIEPAHGNAITLPIPIHPVRPMTIFLLPHSHTDIGYTEMQSKVEEKQMNNLMKGIEYARRTGGYPEGSRFVWNVEVLWAADLFLRRMSPEQQSEFVDAVKRGWVGLNGMYLNELTGLCRPEELLQLFRYSTRLAEICSTRVDAAMISDVPGYTWGTVTAMAQAGVRYFSAAPNYFDRIGDILVRWEDKPFYWMSPSGTSKVLFWIPYKGYALSHGVDTMSEVFVEDILAHLDKGGYPYDITYLRWSGHGDNAVPEIEVSEFVKAWNEKYLWPKFVIASTSTAFRAFEERYGGQLPVMSGDLTPYWEDGAGSSALETAMNRASSDRLSQAEAAWAMFHPGDFPADEFRTAWRDVLLYSEHTWGAWCSVSDPENSLTKDQWSVKRGYALDADSLSRVLLQRATMPGRKDVRSGEFDIVNSTSWPRTDLVRLSKRQSSAGDRVLDDRGKVVPSQRLSNGDLVIVASEVPGFSVRRFRVTKGKPSKGRGVAARRETLDNGIVRVSVDRRTGSIVELRASGSDHNYVDTSGGLALNQYFFLPGDSLQNLRSNGPVTISTVERGPLVAALRIVSDAPGCNSLRREVQLMAGADYVEVLDTIDKKPAPANPKPGDWQFAQHGGKEGVHIAFPFNVGGGVMRLDIPLGMMRPESDQMPGACKNWFTVGRWADVSNEREGITWVTLDAPLVEIGGITARLLGSQTDTSVWRQHVEPGGTLYSWVMNNHWSTNYRASQEGTVAFRYALRPHTMFSPDAATRFATGLSQPLIVVPARGDAREIPRLRVEPDSVAVISFKPSDDGKAWIVRLFGASGKPVRANLTCSKPVTLWLSDTSERPISRIGDAIDVPAWAVVTVRAEFSAMPR